MNTHNMNEGTAGIDLHSHTTASDGELEPAQLVELAAKTGLSALAVTDHDTTGGLADAIEAAKSVQLQIVPGIEISAKISHGQCHLLGYFIDPHGARLNARLNELQEARRQRNVKLLQKLNDLGIKITFEDVKYFAGRDLVARPHFAKALVKLGVVTTAQEAFDKYLAEGASAAVPKEVITQQEAIDLIHEAGGVAILAHPNNLKLPPVETEEAILRMRNMGLDGIEAYYSLHTEEDRERYLDMAMKLDMVVSGGSDFHGESVKPGIRLGGVIDGSPVPSSVLDAIYLLKEKLN